MPKACDPRAAGLADLIRDHAARIAVVGQGYVGLPLAIEFARAGFTVAGLDTDPERVAALAEHRSYVGDVASDEIGRLAAEGRYRATSDFSVLEESDVVVICVPTPLRKSKDPDISLVVVAAEQVAARFRPVQLVVLESTTYPGTTEELLLPLFEARGARVGESLFLAFSPERIDPGNRRFPIREIPKVVGGITGLCREMAALLYGQIVHRVIKVSSPKVAELAKLYENVFRNVNIALANEINRSMPGYVVELVAEALNQGRRCLNGARILALGVAYKRGVGDTRESPALEVLDRLRERGAELAYADPYVPSIVVGGNTLKAVEPSDEEIGAADCVLILTDHPEFDYRRVVEVARLVVDTRHATRGLAAPPGRVVTLRSEERRVGKECRSRWSPDH